MSPEKIRNNMLLRLIAILKLFKATTLVVVGVGALRLLRDNNAAQVMRHLTAKFGLNPGSRYLDHALAGGIHGCRRYLWSGSKVCPHACNPPGCCIDTLVAPVPRSDLLHLLLR